MDRPNPSAEEDLRFTKSAPWAQIAIALAAPLRVDGSLAADVMTRPPARRLCSAACGRITNRYTWSQLVRLYRLTESPRTSNFPRHYNIAPTRTSVVRRRGGQRELAELPWGFVLFWAEDLKIGSRMINAQSETASTKPAFQPAFKSRRCLVCHSSHR